MAIVKINNRMKPSVLGYGYLGEGTHAATVEGTGRATREYHLWQNMLQRAYTEKYKTVRPTYKDAIICKEWHNFQVFAEWCTTQIEYSGIDDKGKIFQLDKDILIKNNKLYSPETCVFVPRHINMLLCKTDSLRGELPIGVCYCSFTGRYLSSFKKGTGNRIHVGRFDTPEEAFQAYKAAKEGWIREVASIWKGKIDIKAYEALMKYEVEITD